MTALIKSYIFILFIFILSSSCQDKDQPKVTADEVLVFGEAFGYCVGDCAHFYRLSNSHLYLDTIDQYTGEPPAFDEVPLNASQYELAAPLLSAIPEYLLKNTDQTIGCPDCADQGGVHLFLSKGAQKHFWHIDTSVDNQPEEIRDYIAQVRSAIDQLQN